MKTIANARDRARHFLDGMGYARLPDVVPEVRPREILAVGGLHRSMRRTNPAYVARYIPRHDYLVMALTYARRGNDLPHAKLNADLVRKIRENRDGKFAWEWAEELNVHVNTIYDVRLRKTWVHV